MIWDLLMVLIAVWIVMLIAVLGFALWYLITGRAPKCCHEHAIPDFIPDGLGGDRPQTKPANRPRS